MAVQFEAICRPRFMTFWDNLGDPLWLSTHLPDYVYRVPFRRYRLLNLPLRCEVVEKTLFLGPRFVGGGDTPDLGHAFSNRTYFRPCGQIWLISVQRARRLAGKKEKEEESQ